MPSDYEWLAEHFTGILARAGGEQRQKEHGEGMCGREFARIAVAKK